MKPENEALINEEWNFPEDASKEMIFFVNALTSMLGKSVEVSKQIAELILDNPEFRPYLVNYLIGSLDFMFDNPDAQAEFVRKCENK